MEISEVNAYSDELLRDLNQLIPQLSSSAALLREADLKNIIDNPAVNLLIARENDICLGSLSLVVFPIPTGIRAWVEDVVVSEKARGKGVGMALSNYAVTLAKKLGAKTVDLTSRPSRVPANKLYQKVGFVLRETNVYRFNCS